MTVRLGNSMKWLAFLTGVILIIVHGFWSDIFVVDVLTVLILFVISIPFVAQFLRKAKFPGAEFEFKEEIRETEKLVQRSVEEAQRSRSEGKKFVPFETFKLSSVKELLNSDPVLALAALRIEIERKLRLLANSLDLRVNDNRSLSALTASIRRQELLSSDQVAALQRIISMCNKAVHGYAVSEAEAREIMELAEDLNKTFAVGYSIDLSPNLDYEKYGLLCEWEHCIERSPLEPKRTELSCGVFGHNCPGGVEKVVKCGKNINDIPKNRFVKR